MKSKGSYAVVYRCVPLKSTLINCPHQCDIFLLPWMSHKYRHFPTLRVYKDLSNRLCTFGVHFTCIKVWIFRILHNCVCVWGGDSYHTQAALSCNLRPHKQQDLIQLAVPHTHVVFLLYLYCLW